MSAESTPAEEPDAVTPQALEERLNLFERGLKERLEEERRKRHDTEGTRIADIAGQRAKHAVWEFKQELEQQRQDRERAERDKKSERSLEWSTRILAASVGFIICLLFLTALSQCTDLRDRLSRIESKQSK